jgi:hypothetical protein
MRQSNLARTIAEQPSTVATTGRDMPLPIRSAASKNLPTGRRKSRQAVPLIVISSALVLFNLAGAPYYLATPGTRVRSPYHVWLKPSGYVGQTAGIIAFLIFVFLWLYPLRKKWKALAFTGTIGRWLDVHVTAALALPLLLTIHAAWHSDGVIGLGFLSMLVVCASGVVGRYLYTRIPRARSGVELTREEVAKQRHELIEEIASLSGLAREDVERTLDFAAPANEDASALRVLGQMVMNDITRWRMARALRARWSELSPRNRPLDDRALRQGLRLARREIALTQQSRMLQATHRVFRYWHVAHRPFALTALVAVVIHVVVVVAVGATWFY